MYESVLEKLKSQHDGIVIISQPHLPPTSDREPSDSETSPFLHTPYVEYEDESRLRQDRIRRDNSGDVSWPCMFGCCILSGAYILVCFGIGVLMGKLIAYYYIHSGCNNVHYLLALFIVNIAHMSLFFTLFAWLCCNSGSCSTQTCLLICAILWLIIILFWFCAYIYMCTT